MTAGRTDCSRLLSLAVHELRTPVSVATGYLRMLQQVHGRALTDEQRKFVLEASQSSARMGELLADLSAVAKFMAGEVPLKRDVVAILRLAADVAASLRDGSERGVRLEVRGADAAVRVIGDEVWLGTALRAIFSATVRERVQPGVLLVECRGPVAGRNRRAVIAIGEAALADALASLPPGQWAPCDQWRGGVGFSLALAAEVTTAHRGRLGSLPGAPRRSAVAIALPVKA